MSYETETEPTKQGVDLIKRWKAAKDRVERLKHDLNAAECEERNAEHALSKWLLPSDVSDGEKIGIWYGDSLFQATGGSEGIQIRTRGKSIYEISRPVQSRPPPTSVPSGGRKP